MSAEAEQQIQRVLGEFRIKCPVHNIPDCSVLLNGCTRPQEMHKAVTEFAAKVAEALAAQADPRAWSPLDHLLDESTVFQYAHFDADENELGNCVLVSDLPTIWERALAAQVPEGVSFYTATASTVPGGAKLACCAESDRVADEQVRLAVADLAELSKRVRELLPVCYITRNEVMPCTDWIGSEFGNGVWLEAMCCLPCRLRALLDRPNGSE